METAAVISRSNGQIVQLPEDFQIDASEVYLKRVGRSVLLIPKDADPWKIMADSLQQFTADFMQDRSQPTEQSREALFE